MKRLIPLLLAFALCASCAAPAYALEYGFNESGSYLFAKPTSDEIIYEQEPVNVDRSKNVAKIAPAFGSPTSYLPNSGEYLTPNLVPGALSGGLVNSLGEITAVSTTVPAGTMGVPSLSVVTTSVPSDYFNIASTGNSSTISFTEVTGDSYYEGGYLGTLKIPAINLSTKIFEGTSDASLAKGAGHFEDTSIWSGNVCLAAHNRGVNSIFGQIHTLASGDKITLTTKLGTRTYSVTSVEKISYTDNSRLESTSEDCITLFTCVRNESSYRWCVRAVAV